MTLTIRGLMEYTNITPIQHIIASFLKTQGDDLKLDYPLEELEEYYHNIYSKGCQSNKDWTAEWQFNKVIQEYKEAT